MFPKRGEKKRESSLARIVINNIRDKVSKCIFYIISNQALVQRIGGDVTADLLAQVRFSIT